MAERKILQCPRCDIAFVARHQDQIHCSEFCEIIHSRVEGLAIYRNCMICQSKFKIKDPSTKYICSQECRDAYNETRNKKIQAVKNRRRK